MNNAGLTIGMPLAVQEVEDAIDISADIEKWINGDETTIPTLRAQGWNFAGDQSTGMIAAAALHGSEELALAMLRECVPVNGPMPASYGDGPTPLMAAAQLGYAELLMRLLENGADVNEQTSSGSTPLMMAALSGIPEMVSALLEAGADVRGTDHLARAALFWGARSQRFNENEDARIDRPAVVRLLVAAGADVNATDEGGDSLLTQYGIENDVLSVLLEFGANPNHIGNGGEIPLEASRDADAVRMLLEAGADPWAMRRDRPVHESVREKSPETARVIDQWLREHPRPAAP